MNIEKIKEALKPFGMEGEPSEVSFVMGPGNLLVRYFTGGDERLALLNDRHCVVWDYSTTGRDRECHYLDHKWQMEREEALPFAHWDEDRPRDMRSFYDELCTTYSSVTADPKAGEQAEAKVHQLEPAPTAGEPAGGGFTRREALEAWQRLEALCGDLRASAVEQVLEANDLHEISLLHAQWILHEHGMQVIMYPKGSARIWKGKSYLGSMPVMDTGGPVNVDTIDLLAMMHGGTLQDAVE